MKRTQLQKKYREISQQYTEQMTIRDPLICMYLLNL